jgi:photosystem II stability/assembly factor-like uncharacterized protein
MLRPLSVALSLVFSAASVIAGNWTSGGPHGGVILSLSASASNPRVIYAGGYGGVFRSDDNGETWRNVTGGLTNVAKVAADPTDPLTAYVVAGNVYIEDGVYRTVNGGVYRTTDGGASWTPMNTNLYRPNKVVIDPTAPKTLYVSGDCGVVFKTGSRHIGVAKSTDGGDTWNDATEGFPDNGLEGCIVSIALDPANPRHLYAQPDFGGPDWETFDGAATWSKTAAVVPGEAFVADPKSLRRFGIGNQKVLASNDGGVTWNVQPADGLPPVNSSGPNLSDMTVDPSVPRLFAGTAYGLYRSGDGGHSWLPAGDAPTLTVHSVLFNSAASTVMMATDEGLFRAPSPAFTPWKHLDVPDIGLNAISDIAVDPQRPSVVFAASADGLRGRLFRSRDAGASWQPMTGPISTGLKVGVDATGDAWFGGNFPDGMLYRVASGKDDIVPVRKFGQIVSIAGSPTVPGRVYVADGQLWRTDDAGATWIRCAETALTLTEITLNPKDPDLIYAAGIFSSLWRSTDGCATFQRLVSDSSNYVMHVASAPSNPSVLYRASNAPRISSTPSVFRSDDGGATWTPLPAQILRDPTKIAVDPHDPYSVWMSFLTAGIRHSSDGGLTWKDVSNGLPGTADPSALSIALDPTGSVLHAGLFRSGVWELHIPPARTRAVR